MKPAKPNRMRTFLAGSRRPNQDSRFAIHDVRRKCGFILAAAFCLMAMSAITRAQVPILYYDFENNATRTTFENLVEQAVNTGSGALTKAGGTGTQLTIAGVAGAGTFNGGAANGQALTTSGGGWDASTTDPGTAGANYYQFVVNTTGFSQLSITFDNQASGTGPARVGVLYSTNGSTFTATTTTLTGNAAFSAASFDLSSITAMDNQSSVTIRLYAFAGSAGDRTGRSAFGASGTFRIDNLTVRAKTVTATKTLLDYPAIGLSIKSGTAFTPTYVDFTVNGGGITASLASALQVSGTFTVSNGGTLNCGTNVVSGAGTFTLASGATLGIGSTAGITSSGATGNIQTTTRNYDTGANYTYNGNGPQLAGNGLPATVNDLTISSSNSSTVALSSSVNVSDVLAIQSGSFLIGANTLTLNNPVSGVNGLNGGNTSSIVIAGSASNINLPSGIELLNFTLNNSNGTAIQGLTVDGTLTLTLGTLDINGSVLNINGAISTTSGALLGTGAFPTIQIGNLGAAATTLPPVTLHTLNLFRTAGITLGGNVTVNSSLSLTAGDIRTTDSFILTLNGDSVGNGDVVGRVHRDDLGTTVKSYGNQNVQISVDAGTTITSMEVYLTKNGTTPATFPTAVQRFYSLDPGPGTLGTATVRLHYLDSELNNNTGSSLHLWHATGPSGGSALWSDQGAPTQAQTGSDPSNWIENNNVTTFSTWALAPGSPGPSAVKLTKFNAASFSDGVQLTWESGFEVNNLGYRLYREQNGKRTRVTPSIVAGSTLLVGQGNRMTAGYSYSWFDPQGTAATAYYLEAIDLDSSRQTYGPIYPYGGSRNGVSPKRERALLLNELGKSLANNSGGADTTGWPASMSAAARSESLKLKPQSLAAQQAIAGGKAVKLQVRQTGWYRVTQPELVAAGFDPASDARLLQLYVDGEEVPVRLSGEGARLNANDTLEFYGVALETQTTDTRTYWLVNGTSAGKRISAKRGKIKPGDQNWTDSPGLRSFAFTAERREKLIYSPRLLNGDGENIFGALIFTDPTEQTLPVKNFDREAATPVQLEVALQGLTAQGHEVHIMLNGVDLGSMTFAASAHSTATFAVSRALLHEGDNTVSLASANGDSDISFVDYVRLTYAHQYTADNNALRFSVPGGGVVRVDGFSTANIRVVDITDPNSPLELATSGSPSGAGYSIKVQALGNDTRTLIAFADDLPAHPASITANQPSNWNASTNGADLVIITHKDFRQAIEPLATLRRNQGMTVAVVDVEDVYDEFSYGAHTPAAIKALLMNAAGTWARKPGYLLLVGDSSWDPRNFMDQGANDFVPTKLIDTNYMETASDDWLVDFTGQGNAAMALGRLPGRTAAEVSLMVSKIMAYEQERELSVPLRGAVMVADSGFETQSAQTSALLPASVSKQSLVRATIGNDDLMRGQLLEALNQGPMIVNFYGHGSVGVWTAAGVLDSEVADTLTNNNRSSIYLMMTCLNGYAHDAYIDSLSESLLKAPNGGAVAVWASSGFTTPEPQFAMDSQFYRLLFGGQPMRLGEAARQAKLATSDLDVRRTWMLLGDPTMRVR